MDVNANKVLTVMILATGENVSKKIKPLNLIVAFGYKFCLVSLYGTISLMIHLINPFAYNWFDIWWMINKIPSFVVF